MLRNFLSAAEAEHIVEQASPSLKRSYVIEDTGPVESQVRTSAQTWLDHRKTEVTRAIASRVAAVTTVPLATRLYEPIQVVHYAKGGKYESHRDYFPPEDFPSNERVQAGVQRMATLFFYLNDVEGGGETIFPRVKHVANSYQLGGIHDYADCTRGMAVAPVKGNAILWYNLKAKGAMAGDVDPRSMHGGCTVTAGEKYGANMWLSNKHYVKSDEAAAAAAADDEDEATSSSEASATAAAAAAPATEGEEIEVTIMRNGGNNSGTEPVFVTRARILSGDAGAAEVARLLAAAVPALDVCLIDCGEKRHVTRFLDRGDVQLMRGGAVALTSTASLAAGDILYVVPKDEHWLWPGLYVGYEQQACARCGPNGTPVVLRTESLAPRVFTMDTFIGDEEAEEIIEVARPRLFKSNVIENGREWQHPGRTSSQTWLRSEQAPAIGALDRRVAKVTRIGLDQRLDEELQVVHYTSDIKARYDAHFDVFQPHLFPNDRNVQNGRQRLITLFFYLNDVGAGGQTCFPRADVPGSYGLVEPMYNNSDCTRGLCVQPTRLKAVLWYNLKDDFMEGDYDVRALHTGCAVLPTDDGAASEKWGCNKWIYNKRPI